ncbi:hypothetical protein B0J13DRAFT_605530 [Dactylonectria estremocensis]|uniref:Zn(2)-C6 fungal-type domain-containing protein n=1 Tax=Dactylonectria estremocensis TaxID=1079267 RepID=A0A9P9J9X7_9HYPO|nr:hypothetical protein B0J13DRAFT_605530 [Dactylonectria estremocensis]
MGRQPRQRPVSCHFCRARKLRCSRVFPCTNCTSRGLPCPEALDPPSLAQPADTQKASSVASIADADVLSRLERLEALLEVRNKQTEVVLPSVDAPNQTPIPTDTVPSGLVQLPLPQPLPSDVQKLTADALFLERSCLDPKLSDLVIAESLAFRVCPIRLITQSTSCYVPSSSLSFKPTKCIWLPQREEARALINKYLDHITYIHHIVHGPSLRALADNVYDSLQQSLHIPVGSIILLTSVCADVTYSWTAQDEASELFSDYREANSQSMFWLKSALDLLDNAQRNGHISVECIQGTLLLSFVVSNIEGISIRARSIISKAVVMARELGMHRIDHPSNSAISPQPRWRGLKAEVGRRVWWYLAATDWLMARFPGPHEGTYSVHPQHMAVAKPLNIEDEDLVEGVNPVGLSMEEPTCMSYFLQRLRLAELSRSFSDRLGLGASNPDMVRYNIVTEIDEALDQFFRNIPKFFTLSAKELGKLPPTDPRRSPAIIVQRHVIKLFVHGQRCKLHIPFFARGAVEPAYARSREICLQNAQIILETEHELEKEKITFVSTRLRLAAVLHSVFLASIALLLDLCLRPGAGDKTKSRQQMTQVWRILEDAHGLSIPAAKLQELLRQVMKKYKVPLPVIETNSLASRMGNRGDATPITPGSVTNQELWAEPSPSEQICPDADLGGLIRGWIWMTLIGTTFSGAWMFLSYEALSVGV